MAAPTVDVVRSSDGYHPNTSDLEAILAAGKFAQLLVLGAGVVDVVDLVDEIRLQGAPPVTLPQGIYWFTSVDPSVVLLVTTGSGVVERETVRSGTAAPGSPLDNALNWVDALWDEATVVPAPRFEVGEDVLVSGRDGVVRPGRRFAARSWLYQVFEGGSVGRRSEDQIEPRPVTDDPLAWVESGPVEPHRFAATLTRAKLEGHFTDTVFSFRATRTLFRPYQFKPVLKLLSTGTLRLLIADEVGLGKTIEAGLVWTEMEARRQADRVLVICPSSLVAKWRREMEDRFGFTLVELDNPGLQEMTERLETDRLPRRGAYICSIERLRTWEGLKRAAELGLNFDLSIVDEAHAFRNRGTKSFALGEMIQDCSEALVMLSATPVNLHNQDLYNLLSILVPGEFQDLRSLEHRISPNRVLNRLTSSLADPGVSNADRRAWLAELQGDLFGSILTQRPDFRVLLSVLERPTLDAAGAVAVKRLCAELNGLSAQITRTRKVDVQEAKPLRELRQVDVNLSPLEAEFYEAYHAWCRERARLGGTPINFSMQMPLRLAGSCLPEAARFVIDYGGRDDPEVDDVDPTPQPDSSASAATTSLPPDGHLVGLARSLATDTKFDRFQSAVLDLVKHRRRAIVFTFSRRTLRYLERRLRGVCRVAVLHGGVGRHQRQQVMADFRDGCYDVLLATKVASEGLDFEFCSAVVNYDLPWNPMEVEQRIGRIDRIGQVEKKITVVNFHTPGTIESDIVERVLNRIQIFQDAIGGLEPIVEAKWTDLREILCDFSLTPAQQRQRADEIAQAVEMKAQDLEWVESAAPMLVSSDGADVDGLERDLLATGRYVGQEELCVLVTDWVRELGGDATRENSRLVVRGNAELAEAVQVLAKTGERSTAEVAEIAAALRSEGVLTLSLDHEVSRTTSLPLLTATHPLTRAAATMSAHRHGRFTRLRMTPEDSGVQPGMYLVLLSVVHWNGVRPLHEVWAASIDLTTLSDAGDALGSAVMEKLATASFEPADDRGHLYLADAVDRALMNLEGRVATRREELMEENKAFLDTRRASYQDVHKRRMDMLQAALDKLIQKGQTGMMPAAKGRIQAQKRRYEEQLAALRASASPSLVTDDLAVCVVEVIR